MKSDLWAFEKNAATRGYARIAGLDEAGRGPLAGPVVAAAVVLGPSFPADGVFDSKQLSEKKREALYAHIHANAVSIGIGVVDAGEIDRINILNASLLAMSQAVQQLNPSPDFLLVDGTFPVPVNLPQKPIVKGDARSVSIAAASIVAKVTRDGIMRKYDEDYPGFGFAQNKGYPTRAHREALKKYGYCPIHRQTYKGVNDHMSQTDLPFRFR